MGTSSRDVSNGWPPLRSVLISGATGWLGTCLAKEFLDSDHGYTVVLLARQYGSRGNQDQVLSILVTHGAKIVLLPDTSYNLEGLTDLLKGGIPPTPLSWLPWGKSVGWLHASVHPRAKSLLHQTLLCCPQASTWSSPLWGTSRMRWSRSTCC